MKLAGVLLMAAALGCCARAHYRDAYSLRNTIDSSPEDEIITKDSDIVECPVCEISPWLDEDCSMKTMLGMRGFKRCKYGTYVNEVCGNRLDCFRGPNETCTEKQERDMHGKRCMNGTYCIKSTGRCSDQQDVNQQWAMNRVTNFHQYKFHDQDQGMGDNRKWQFPLPITVRRISPWQSRDLY